MKWTEIAIILVIAVAFAGFVTILITDEPAFEKITGEEILSPLDKLIGEARDVCILQKRENNVYTGTLISGESIHQANLLITRAIRNNGFTPCSTMVSSDSTMSFFFADKEEKIRVDIDYGNSPQD